jgi:FAD/FMN-containing dehydrogenase
MTPPPIHRDPRVCAAYSEAAGIYRIVPAGVAVPATTGELVALMGWAGETGTPLVPRGAGSGMAGSNVGEGVVVDLTALDGAPVRVDREARVAIAGAAATWAAVQAAAAPAGLRFPPNPSSGRFATVGGMVSTNAAGARSFRSGSARRWVTGALVVTADGEVTRLRRGAEPEPPVRATTRFALEAAPHLRASAELIRDRFPRTRKNSAGFALDAWLESGDLLDLVIGAEGTLGVVTEASLALEPIPEARGGLRLWLADDDRLAAAIGRLRQAGPASLELMDGSLLRYAAGGLPPEDRDLAARAGALLLCEFEGEAGEVRDAVAAARAMAAPLTIRVDAARDPEELDRLWTIRHAASPILARLGDRRRSLQVIEDGCVPPERLTEYLAAIRSITAACGLEAVLFGHAGDGHVHVNLLPDPGRPGWEEQVAAVYRDTAELVRRLGGTPSGEHGDGRLRSGLLEPVFGAEVMALFRLVKGALDPAGLLNPGVLLPDGAPALSRLKVGAGAAPLPSDIAEALRTIECEGRYGTSRLTLAGLPATAWAPGGGAPPDD